MINANGRKNNAMTFERGSERPVQKPNVNAPREDAWVQGQKATWRSTLLQYLACGDTDATSAIRQDKTGRCFMTAMLRSRRGADCVILADC